jgi:MFS family permease
MRAASDDVNSNLKINFRFFIAPLVAYLILAMFRLSIGMVIPEAMVEYDLIEAEGGALLTSLLGATAIFIMLGGNLSDRIGKYVAMSIGFTIMSFGMILAGRSIGYYEMLFFLFIAGIGSGIFTASLYAFVGDIQPGSRGALVGITNAFYGIGGFIGPWITAILILNNDWHSPFYLMGLLALTLSCFLWAGASTKGNRKKVGRTKINYRSFLRDINIIFLCAAIAIANFAFSSYSAWAPSYLNKIGMLDLSDVGLAFGSYSITGALGAIFYGTLSDKIGRRKSIIASGFPAFFISLFYFSGQIKYASLMLLSVVLGFTSYAYWNLAISALQDRVDNRYIGSATGIMLSFALVSAAIAPAVSGFMITNYGISIALILSIALPQLIYTILASKAIG